MGVLGVAGEHFGVLCLPGCRAGSEDLKAKRDTSAQAHSSKDLILLTWKRTLINLSQKHHPLKHPSHAGPALES